MYLDTHAAVFLFKDGEKALPSASNREIELCLHLRISPMVRLELQYLYEIGRINEPSLSITSELEAMIGLETCDAPFIAVVKAAESFTWTRDPFDRLIAAQASLQNSLLITKDKTIHNNYQQALWDNRP